MRSTARWQRLPLAAGGLVVLVGLASFVLAAVNLGDPPPAFEVHPEFFLPDAGLALVYGPAGALIASRSRHVAGWALLVVGLGFGVTALGIQYAVLGANRPGVPWWEVGIQLVVTGWIVGALTALLVLPWLLGSGPIVGLRRVGILVGVALVALAGVTRFLSQVEGGPPNPVSGGTPVAEVAAAVDGATIPVYSLVGLGAAVHLLLRARAEPRERRRLTWAVVSVALLAVSYLALELGFFLDGPPLGVAAPVVVAAHVMLLAAVFALVAQPSWGADLAVSRTVVGALLTTAVLASYVLIVWALSHRLPWSQESAGVVAVALLALAVVPLRSWIQRHVDRLVFGSGAEVTVLLDRLGAQIGAASDERSVLEGLADGLRAGLRLRGVEVESCVAHGPRVLSGRLGPSPVAITLRSRDRTVGALRLSAPAGERLDPRTVRLLEQISGLVAMAVDLATVNLDLETARTRILDVRQEERRLLRRELHDGLGPSLSGVALALAAIDRTSTLEPEDAALLERLRQELSRRAADVREMARALLPPALEDGRLGEALQVLARRFSDGGFTVLVDAEAADEIDSGRQVAIYHIATEGVLNSYRHAGARQCRIALRHEGDGRGVRLTVQDDGTGLGNAAAPGIGLSSMRERAAELGGTFVIDSTGDGARLTVVLP
ncbi:sensor histidine kinase [Actinotalea soli]|uniref:sensor histidine kinase n=1 Tax=Actinotalea soli TaxID=2819234 RepID=UPI001AA15E0A|nr:ATP-binding protein [Actinotalea soli]